MMAHSKLNVRLIVSATILVIGCFYGASLWARQINTHAAGASCHMHMDALEGPHGIPHRLLSAIGLTESGHVHPVSKEKVAWPWAVHAEGKAYYPQTKIEAIRIVRDLQKKGVQSIDVGCMQVNLYHHKGAFKSLEEAFDPEKNVRYAASFLKRLQADKKTWQTAVAHYHSATPEHGHPYRSRVYKVWNEERRKTKTPEAQGIKLATATTGRSVVSLHTAFRRQNAQPIVLTNQKMKEGKILKVGVPFERKIPKNALLAHNKRFASAGIAIKSTRINKPSEQLVEKS